MPNPRTKPAQKWSMRPSLHEEVAQLLQDDDLVFKFYPNDSARACVEEYDTNVMGHFTCTNTACSSSGWSSKKIAITIRMYNGGRYNARVYHQRCLNCNHLSRPKLDHSYAERVAYRLKKWNGIDVEAPPHAGNSRGPHQSNLCEGCRTGRCTERA